MWLDNASDIDILFYDPYAQLISSIAKDKINSPLTIGVFGLWGAGKSTLLNLIEHQLDKADANVACVKINAWMFEGYEDAKIALMETLLKELCQEKKFEKAKNKIKNLLSRIKWFKVAASAICLGASITASVATGNPLPIVMSVPRTAEGAANAIKEISDNAEDIKETYINEETHNQQKESIVDNIRKFRIEFEEMIKSAEIDNVVIIVDDLDRCTPERIIDTLEAIKLFLSVSHTIFIIAADENVIQYAIKKKYPPVEGMNVELSTEYIEKIIQLPIYIPELSSKDIENYLLLLVTQRYLSAQDFQSLLQKIYEERVITRDNKIALAEIKAYISELNLKYTPSEKEYMEDALIVDSIRSIVSVTLKGNPRQAKRFLNTFVTKKRLSQMYYGDDLDMRILAKLLVLQKLDPDLFNELNAWNKEFTVCNDKFKDMYESVMSGKQNVDYTKWAVPEIQKWLDCEPKELYEQRLNKYFYLTRENLAKNIIDQQNFSEEAKRILERIGLVSEGTIKGIVDDLKILSPVDIDNVLSVLYPRMENGQLEYFVIKELFIGFKAYQNKIADAISKSRSKITPANSTYLTIMYKENSKIMLPILEKMKSAGTLSEKMYNKIIEKKD